MKAGFEKTVIPYQKGQYRKAKNEDVRCCRCIYYNQPLMDGMLGRCGFYDITNAVGKGHTCNKATEGRLPPTKASKGEK